MPETEDASHQGAANGPSQRRIEAAVGLAVAAFGALVVVGSLQVGIGWGSEGPRSGFFPFYVGLAILIASAFNLLRLRGTSKDAIFAEWHQIGQVALIVVPTTIYVFVLPYTGLYLASVVLIAGFMLKLGNYRLHTALGVAICVMVALFVTFEKWFLVSLPKGPIEEFLGL